MHCPSARCVCSDNPAASGRSRPISRLSSYAKSSRADPPRPWLFAERLEIAGERVARGLERAVHVRFGLPPELPVTIEQTIKRADRTCAFFEACQIAGFDDTEARRIFSAPRGIAPFRIRALDTEQSQARYLDRFEALFREHEKALAR